MTDAPTPVAPLPVGDDWHSAGPPAFAVIREEIKFQHGQIDSRMNWSMAAQALLLVAAADLLDKPPATWCKMWFALAIVGLILAIVQHRSIWAAINKVELLRKKEEVLLGEAYEKDEQAGNNRWPVNLDNALKGKKAMEGAIEDRKMPAWYVGSPGDIDRGGGWYPKVAPCLFVVLWLGAATWSYWQGKQANLW